MTSTKVRRVSAMALALVAALLAAGSAASKAASPNAKPKQPTPAQLVAASKKESGLVVYGNPPAANFKVLTEAFTKKYPWIKVTSYDLDNNVIFSKYASEAAQRSRTADLLISSAPNLWVYANRQHYVVDFAPTGIGSFPSFVKQYKGVFVLSPDPAIAVYNKLLLKDKVPNSLTTIAQDSSTYNKLTGYTVDNLFGYTALWGYVQKKGWTNLQRIGKSRFRAQTGVAGQLQLLSQGAANVAYLTSPTARFTIANSSQLSNILAWTYLKDATPLVPRGIGITRKASSPASAKLFLNYVYSTQGQQTMCEAGFTAFRLNFKPRNCSNTLNDVYAKVGRKNVQFVPFSQKFVNDQPSFRARWHQIFG
ncbi:MAG TPA: extracellular solute-binding protein [Gaiellaceae bacterium]|nr:extracellular solute-binding protein [Gaiellaceae bacterium]